jgi:hypothetical protein
MPNKLKVLVGLQVVGIAADVWQSNWIALAIHGLLLLGILSGHEAVRTLLVFFAWIGAAINGVMLVFTDLGVPVMLLPGGGGLFAAIGAVVSQTIAFAIPAFVLWCLKQEDVQNWMMRRSINLTD